MLSERASPDAYVGSGKYWLRRIVGRWADMIVANSEQGARYWRAAGYVGALHVIPNIVPASAGGPSVRDPDADASARIVAVGRLCEQKNYPVLIKALERVLAVHAEASVEVLGEGHLRQSLQQQIDESPLLKTRVRLVGFVDDVARRLRRATLFVSTSRYEGTANAQLDAMMAGCPMVLSDIPTHREMADDSTAVFAKLDDVEQTAAAISRCLSDPSLRRAMAQRARGRLRLEDWAAERIAERYLALYDQLIRGRDQ
jgi:glycosyltransferase involved in cell wall biosynthesis